MGFGNNILHQDRGFYYADSEKNDLLDGRSLEHPKKTMQGAINGAAGLTPPPSTSATALVREAQGGLYFEDLTLAASVLFEGSQTTIISTGLVGVDAASFVSFRPQTLVNNTDNAVVLRCNNVESFGTVLSAMFIGGDNAKGIVVSGTYNNMFFEVNQTSLRGDNALAVNVTGTGVNPLEFNFKTVLFEADGGQFFVFDPVNASDSVDVTIASLFDSGANNPLAYVATKGFEIKNGVAKLKAGSLQATDPIIVSGGQLVLTACAVIGNSTISGGNAIYDSVGVIFGNLVVSNAATLQVRSTDITGDVTVNDTGGLSIKADQVNGNITIAVGATAYLDIDSHVGTLTNNGTINGVVNGIRYGNREIAEATVTTDATITGDGSAGDPLSVATSIAGGITVIGFWNADTNTPDLSALTLNQGESYQVSVSGSTSLNGETNWKAKDLVVWSDALAGNYFKLDNTDDVLSVSGKTGVVTLVKGDVGLGNVDNTSDANKPVSTAQQTALNLKADKDGETITNATVNGVTIISGGSTTKVLKESGSYTTLNSGQVLNNSTVDGAYVTQALNELNTAVFGELRMNTNGNQSLGTTISKLDFDQNGSQGSTSMTVSIISDSITTTSAGWVRVAFHASVELKRDARYQIFYRINGDDNTDEEIACVEVPEDNDCWAVTGIKSLNLANGDYIELWATCAITKTFNMQKGSTFTLTKI